LQSNHFAVFTKPHSSSKPPIVRNPRACTVCRAAKVDMID
jgi:hypothetical protein